MSETTAADYELNEAHPLRTLSLFRWQAFTRLLLGKCLFFLHMIKHPVHARTFSDLQINPPALQLDHPR